MTLRIRSLGVWASGGREEEEGEQESFHQFTLRWYMKPTHEFGAFTKVTDVM